MVDIVKVKRRGGCGKGERGERGEVGEVGEDGDVCGPGGEDGDVCGLGGEDEDASGVEVDKVDVDGGGGEDRVERLFPRENNEKEKANWKSALKAAVEVDPDPDPDADIHGGIGRPLPLGRRGKGAERPQRLERISVRGIHAGQQRQRLKSGGRDGGQTGERRAERAAKEGTTRHQKPINSRRQERAELGLYRSDLDLDQSASVWQDQ